LACDDLRARHVLEACRRCGLRVPHGVAVIGVDDDGFICELAEPLVAEVVRAVRDQACGNVSIAEIVKLSGLSRWVLEDP
jgi:DNA-binding LacI/PurR family transcriptional regulator